MCGIGGIMRTDGEPIPEEWLDAIDARIAYRGPDGQGRFRDRVEIDTPDGKKVIEIALVHRRLSIIDHEDGSQPMVSERGRDDTEGLVAVVFNGCIYNHRELREELEAAGHTFVTDHSDTEVLIHGHREWGRKLSDHLEGMYAYAIWDRNKATLFCSRDWFGEKPLYLAECYGEDNDPILAFSSEAGALRAMEIGIHSLLTNDRVVDAEDYLKSGYCTGVDSQFWLVGNTFPGFSFSHGEVYTENKPLEKVLRLARRRSTAVDMDQLLDQAVRRRLEADVPLGCFLSGGVDSSLIAHFAKKHKPDLRTFSVRMPDPRYDESHHAELAASQLATNHTTLECDPNPAEDLINLINLLGQPFGDSSILPTYWVSKAAREHVKVAIAGDGGDELFIGYERYLAADTLARHYRWLRHIPSRLLKRFHPKSRLNKFGRLGDMARDYPHLGIAAMESIFTQKEIADLLELPSPSGRGAGGEGSIDGGASESGELADSSPSPGSLREPPSPTPGQGRGFDALAALRQHDIYDYLPYDLLTKVDTASMACGLEVRCPFLDRDLAAAALSMPIDQLIPGGKRKGLLRNIARKYLPAAIVDRPKMGFAIPIGEWFRSDFGGMKTLLLDHLQSAEPFGPISLNRKAVQRFIDEHLAGRYDHGQRLFTLLTLSIWARSL